MRCWWDGWWSDVHELVFSIYRLHLEYMVSWLIGVCTVMGRIWMKSVFQDPWSSLVDEVWSQFPIPFSYTATWSPSSSSHTLRIPVSNLITCLETWSTTHSDFFFIFSLEFDDLTTLSFLDWWLSIFPSFIDLSFSLFFFLLGKKKKKKKSIKFFEMGVMMMMINFESDFGFDYELYQALSLRICFYLLFMISTFVHSHPTHSHHHHLKSNCHPSPLIKSVVSKSLLSFIWI